MRKLRKARTALFIERGLKIKIPPPSFCFILMQCDSPLPPSKHDSEAPLPASFFVGPYDAVKKVLAGNVVGNFEYLQRPKIQHVNSEDFTYTPPVIPYYLVPSRLTRQHVIAITHPT